ncbi:g9061 [Coccomyxa viridis]|uniref:G9061 protein n=1 Tax=Coccomyxa viridis TaxID=1274662 RepID=A0ABP1G1Y9_9CHLO
MAKQATAIGTDLGTTYRLVDNFREVTTVSDRNSNSGEHATLPAACGCFLQQAKEGLAAAAGTAEKGSQSRRPPSSHAGAAHAVKPGTVRDMVNALNQAAREEAERKQTVSVLPVTHLLCLM